MVLPRGWWWSGAGGWLRLTLVSLLAALPVEQLRAFPSSLSDCQTPTGWNCSEDPNSQELLQSTEERLANTMKMTDTSVHKDYQHRLVCVTERKRFQIPVVAIGPRAILHFPDESILPICPVKAATEKTPYVRTIGNSSDVSHKENYSHQHIIIPFLDSINLHINVYMRFLIGAWNVGIFAVTKHEHFPTLESLAEFYEHHYMPP